MLLMYLNEPTQIKELAEGDPLADISVTAFWLK